MRKWLVGVGLWLGLVVGASAQMSQSGLINEVNTKLPSCGNNCINAVDLRQVLIDMINSIYAIIIPSNFQAYGPQQLQYWGYVGDGSSHPLSSVTVWQGQNTTGWTLGQWQAVLPAAGSLSDEIDGVVVNSLIQLATGPVAFSFGTTNGQFSGPIKSCINNVSFYGSGAETSKFTFANSDGWQHCRGPGDPIIPTRVELKNFQFVSTVRASGNYGFTGTFQPQDNANISNVQFVGFSNCGLFENAAGMKIDYMVCSTQRPAGDAAAGVGLEIRGGINAGHGGAFINHITDSRMQGYDTGYKWYVLGIGLEDQRLTNSAAGQARQCVEINGNAASGNYSPFEYSIDNFSCDATTHGVNAVRAWHLKITGGDWLVDLPTGSWTGAGSNFFDMCRVNGVTLRDAWVSNNANAINVASYVRLRNDTNCGATAAVPLGVQITGNYFEVNNLTATDAVIAVDTGSQAVLFKNNTFLSSFVPFEPSANFFRWSTTDPNSALFRNINTGIIVQNGNNSQAISNVTPFNIAQVTVPPGIWTCGGSIFFQSLTGGPISVVQGALNNVSATLPGNPNGGMFLQQVNITAGNGGTWSTGTWSFDSSSATTSPTLYLVGIASFTGTAQASGVVQCTRTR